MKKIFALILAVVMLFTALPLSVLAAGDSIETATDINLAYTYYGNITETNAKDVYRFTISSSGRITIKLDAYIYRTSYYLYDANGNTVWEDRRQYWNDITEKYALNTPIDLTKGTYYFAVCQEYGTGNYNFKINFSSSNESFSETGYGNNNSVADSDVIKLNTKYNGQIAQNDGKDLYKIYVAPGKITIKLDAYICRTSYYLYDADGNTVWENRRQYWNDISKKYTMSEKIALSSGTYYFAVCQEYGTGNYNFSINCGHVYNNVNNYKCSNCGYTVTTPAMRKTNGVWYYYNKGVIDKSNTLAYNNGNWYHVNGGKWVKDTTLVKYNNKYYYVENGIKSYKNTLVYFEGKWRHVNNGKYVKDTTLVKYNNKYYYVKDGKKCKDNTLVFFEGKWRHVNNGKYVKDTTLVKYNNKYYYVKNGKKCMDNTLVFFEGKWRHVNNGKYVKDTTLVKYNNKWYYVKDGKKCKDNTIVKYNGKWYHVKNGKWVKDITFVRRNGKYYYVKNGIVTYVTGKVKVGGKWYRVKDGIRY